MGDSRLTIKKKVLQVGLIEGHVPEI